MESIQSKLVKLLLPIFKLNKMWELTGDELRNSIGGCKYFCVF